MDVKTEADAQLGFATRAIHHGYDPLDYQGALSPPMFLTSTFAFPDVEEAGRRFAGEAPGFIYSRRGNPTVALLECRLASLEGAEAALATASGMGAITTAVWALTHFRCCFDAICRGVHDGCVDGITVRFYVNDPARAEGN